MGKLSMTTLLLLGGFAAGWAQEPTPKAEPERYNGIIMVMGARGSGVTRVTIRVDRLSTEDERKTYLEALKSKGSDGLAQAMEKVTVGSIQFDQNLAYPLAYAIKVATEKGTMIRVATNRPISFTEQMQGFVSKDYQIGIAEFTLSPDGKGEGTILGASKVEFNDKGQLQVHSLPQNTGPQKITEIERVPIKGKRVEPE